MVLRYTFSSPVFHGEGFGILVPKFATLGLKFLMYFLWLILGKPLGFSVFLPLDTLISISCPLRATRGRLNVGFQLFRLKSLKHALPNVYLTRFLGSMDTFTRFTDA